MASLVLFCSMLCATLLINNIVEVKDQNNHGFLIWPFFLMLDAIYVDGPFCYSGLGMVRQIFFFFKDGES